MTSSSGIQTTALEFAIFSFEVCNLTEYFMCFLYLFHNYSKMQLSWLSTNQHKEIRITVQGKSSFFIYWTFVSSAFRGSVLMVRDNPDTWIVSVRVFTASVVPTEDPSPKERQRVNGCTVTVSSISVKCPSGHPLGSGPQFKMSRTLTVFL